MTDDSRRELAALVAGIQPGGGTNLGGGLEAGLSLFAARSMADHHRKLLLISDGLANHGVTDPHALGRMAAAGLSRDWVVSTVGVGNDFNEHLMTTLADYGGGTYTYMEDPAAFAAVFQQEYRHAAATAASGSHRPFKRWDSADRCRRVPDRDPGRQGFLQPGRFAFRTDPNALSHL